MTDAPNQPDRPRARFFSRRPLRSPQEALHPEAAPPPPPPKTQKRRARRLGAFSGFLSFLLVLAIAGVAAFSALQRQLEAPGSLPTDKVVFIAPRSEVVDIIDQLHAAGVIDAPTLLKAALWVEGRWGSVKAGEYLFRKEASLRDVMDTLVSGKQLLHSVTIPEGLTSEQIVQRLMESDVLVGDVREVPREGTILPETYRVPRGMSRAELIRKMQVDQNRLVDQIWARRAPDLPIRSKFELVTLASIVEKETGRADERTRVAAVFHNRLNKRMRLQSDPTIVYGLVGGKGTLGRPIMRAEITRPTAYNTYAIDGLPPGPIANPGRAALEAVANPSRTRDLFFVADGSGGHVFAETLEQHNRNVARWREVEREARERATTPDLPVDRVAPVEEPASEPAAADRARGQRRGDLGPAVPGGEGAGPKDDPVVAADAAPIEQAPAPAYGGLLGLDAPVGFVVAAYGSAATTGPWGALPRLSAVAEAKAPANDRAWRTAGGPLLGLRPLRSLAPATALALGPGVSELGLSLAAGPPRAADLLDGPATPPMADGEGEAANLTIAPLDERRIAEMQARAARLGLQPAVADPGLRATRTRVVDASEGTRLDPLRNKTWDLNSPQTIPPFSP
jgi:UPF0755 protein